MTIGSGMGTCLVNSNVLTFIYCDNCKKLQPLGIADMRQDERFQNQGVWVI